MKSLGVLNASLFAAIAFNLNAQHLPGLYLTNATVLPNGWGQFEVRTPDSHQPYVLLRCWAKDFCYGLPRWGVEEHFPLNSATNRYLITLPVTMSDFGSIFWRAAPLGQPMYWLHYEISSHFTLSNGLGVVLWPKQPDGWRLQLTVQNATNFPPRSEVVFTGPPDSLISNETPDSDSGGSYKHYYQVSGPSAAPPSGIWHVQYGAAQLPQFSMVDPQVSSRYVVLVPSFTIFNGLLTSVSWTYHDPTTGATLTSLPDYIAGSSSVTASVSNGEDYDSPPADRTRTTHVFDPPLEWSNVESVSIGFQDNLGNWYDFYYRK